MVSSERVFSSPGSIVGSPILNNPFDHLPTPAQSVQHTEILTAGPGASVASANPLEVMFCACCGSQNVVGRPSCWRCSTMFSWFTANNGTDHFNAHGNQSGAPQCPSPSMSPSEAFAIQGAGAASACIANAAAGIASATPVVGCASIAAPIGALVTEGTAGQQGAGLGGMPVSYPMGVQCGFNPNGPRIQGGHIVPTCHGVGQAVANYSRNPAPSNQGAATFSIHTPRNSSTSHGSSSSKSSTGDALIQPPQDGWLFPGETDENVYKLKHLRSIQITKLPNDATSCREWRAAFLAAVSRVDMTSRDVLVKFATYCMEGGRGRRFREQLQNANEFLLFNKHVAVELIKPEVLSTNTELAHELTSWVESCSAKQQGPKGMALMHIIIFLWNWARPIHCIELNAPSWAAVTRKDSQRTSRVRKEGELYHAWIAAGWSTCWGHSLQLAMAPGQGSSFAAPSDGQDPGIIQYISKENLQLAVGEVGRGIERAQARHELWKCWQGLKGSPPAQLALPA